MSRIIGIDYGSKRCGLAATDPLGIAVHGLATIENYRLFDWLMDYLRKEDVEKIVIGWPESEAESITKQRERILNFKNRLKKAIPHIPVEFQNEDFSSVKAKDIILGSGAGRKKRRDKSLVDKISAVVILQEYLGHI